MLERFFGSERKVLINNNRIIFVGITLLQCVVCQGKAIAWSNGLISCRIF